MYLKVYILIFPKLTLYLQLVLFTYIYIYNIGAWLNNIPDFLMFVS